MDSKSTLNYNSIYEDWSRGNDLDECEYVSSLPVDRRKQWLKMREKAIEADPHFQWQQGVNTYVETGKHEALNMALEYVTETSPPYIPIKTGVDVIEDNMTEVRPKHYNRSFLAFYWAFFSGAWLRTKELFATFVWILMAVSMVALVIGIIMQGV